MRLEKILACIRHVMSQFQRVFPPRTESVYHSSCIRLPRIQSPSICPMSSELSVFRKMNTVGLYILCKAEPPAWSQTTVLMRCLTRENQELCIIATRDAVDTLRNLETLRAYEMSIAGTCVGTPWSKPASRG